MGLNRILFIVIAFIIQDSIGQWSFNRETDYDDRPVWGYYDRISDQETTTATTTTTSSSMNSVESDDPCAPFDPPVPDFSAPGRRVSEVKCYEYIWQMKVRDDLEQRQKLCEIKARTFVHFILGGHFTLDGDYPNLGAIGWKPVVGSWKFKCGGTLISPKFVLTAAHCSRASERDTTLEDPEPKIVRFGDKNIRDDNKAPYLRPNDANIQRVIVHPSYNSPKQYYDIALIELDRELTFSRLVQPGCLWSKPDVTVYTRQADVAGWGVDKAGAQESSSELLAARVDLIDSNVCDNLLKKAHNRNWNGLANHQICAGKLEGGIDACQGDSGGPLQESIPLPIKTQGSMYYIVGVTSFGVGCGLPGLPGVYTRVSSFVDWIESIVWPESYQQMLMK